MAAAVTTFKAGCGCVLPLSALGRLHACSVGQRVANPPKRCEGDAVAVGMPDGSMLIYCAAGGPWTAYPKDHDVLSLASEAPALVERHYAECPGGGR